MYELRVLTGLHRGAALPLSGQQWWMGAAQDADLALFDPGIKDRHCQLVKTEKGWEVTALEGPLNDNEGQRREQLTDLQPGTAFALGHIWLSIVSASTPWPEEPDENEREEDDLFVAAPAATAIDAAESSAAPIVVDKRPLPIWAKALYLLLILLLVMMLGSWVLQDSLASPSAPPAPGKPLLSSVERTRQVVTSMLLDRGLEKSVALASDGHSLTLSGSISSEDNQRLERMLSNLYQRFDVQLPIHNRATAVSTRLPFNIVQISSGPHANIVTADGRRIFIGDEIDRLRLVAISADSIEFSGRENIKVKW